MLEIWQRRVRKILGLAALLTLGSMLAVAQTATLSLSSGSGQPGSVVTLNLTLTATTTQPTAVQWTLTYPTKDFSAITVSAGPAATAASKSVTCNNATAGVSTCVVEGTNANTIANGVVATVALTISNTTTDTSSTIGLSGGVSVMAGGSVEATTASGTTVTISLPTQIVTGIKCTPDSVIPPAPSTCQVTLSSAAASGGTSVSISANSSSVIVPTSLSISGGSSSGSFQVATSSVTSTTTAQITASLGSSSAMFPLSLVSPTSTGILVDTTVSQNSTAAGTTITTPSLTTNYPNELLLAFVSGGPGGGLTVTSVTGASLTWVLVQRTNTQSGTAEVWRTFAPTVLSGATVTATFSASVYSSITVETFSGVDPTGTSGSGAIGATVSANAGSGAPTATLTTTRDNSLVMAVGTDSSSASARTPGPLQNLVSQDLSANGRTFWVQTNENTTLISGTAVTINDLAPTSDAYDFSAVEILPPSACLGSMVPATRSFVAGGGSTTAQVATGPGCNWTATTNSSSWVTFNTGSGTGNGSFTMTVAANTTGQARLATVSAGTPSLEIMEGGTTAIFSDVPYGSQFFDYISLMYQDAITVGCSTSPLMYCPATSVTRAEMAVFIVVALDLAMGTSLSYPTTPYFQDVASSSPYFPFVQRIAQLGITAGCSTSPAMFCPTNTITQEEMAVFMIVSWELAEGLTTFTYTETPYFTDVPASSPYFKFVQKMMDMGFWTGCGSDQYCPTSAVTRADMAPMVMRAMLGAP